MPVPANLLKPDWAHVEKTGLDDFTAADWAVLERQRHPYLAEVQAEHALRLLTVMRDDPTFGYRVNTYTHCLQSATLAMQAGEDEEAVVAALFHDIGFTACPATHGAFAAALLEAYVGEANTWMLRHHALFQQHHEHGRPGADPAARERWRGHPWFSWTARFVARYDQIAIDPDFATADITVFRPMVHRIFARTPRVYRPV